MAIFEVSGELKDLYEGDIYVSVVYPTLIKQIHKLAGIQLKTQRGMQIRNELVDNIEIRFSLNDEGMNECSYNSFRFRSPLQNAQVNGQKFPGAEEEILLTIVAEIDRLNDNQTEADVLEQQAVQLEVIKQKVPRVFYLECEFGETTEPHLEK